MNQRPTDRPRALRSWTSADGKVYCGECCNGDRCDDPTHYSRQNCPYCKGSGRAIWTSHEWTPEERGP